MSDIAIKVENLSKLYQLGEVGTGTISHDLNRWWARLRGKEDPFAKVGQTNDRTQKAESDFVWALKDINFEVKQGEVLGIIGRNGAGKSTLLKILSKVTSPTTGKIYTKGRIASLLEVGTGFHQEMTGRENIYLNGAILGMRKWEIDKKFDEIVDFAGVEAYIDTPVKRYSSGMYVRLAFAVAAFLEPEILIVDEVLAVGDAEFQKKCLGRMEAVSQNEGRTILFVSHNLEMIRQLSEQVLMLEKGSIMMHETKNMVLEYYSQHHSALRSQKSNIQVFNTDLLELVNFKCWCDAHKNTIHYILQLRSKVPITFNALAVLVYSESNQRIGILDLRSRLNKSSKKNIDIQGEILNNPLLEGCYRMGIYISSTVVSGNYFDLTELVVSRERNPDQLIPFDRSVRGFIEFNHSFEINHED